MISVIRWLVPVDSQDKNSWKNDTYNGIFLYDAIIFQIASCNCTRQSYNKCTNSQRHTYNPGIELCQDIAWLIASPISAQPFNTRKTDNNAQGNDIIIAIINA